MNAFWGLGQLMFSKTIIVVDKDVDVQNAAEVAWIVGTHSIRERDIQFTRGPVDDLDDASDLPAYGSKMGIDATRKWASRRLHAAVADADRRRRRRRRAKAEAIWEKIRQGMEGMTSSSAGDGVAGERSATRMRAILDSHDLIAVGVRGDEVRRRLHGARDDVRPRVRGARRRAAGRRCPARRQRGRDSASSGRPRRWTRPLAAVRAARALAGGVAADRVLARGPARAARRRDRLADVAGALQRRGSRGDRRGRRSIGSTTRRRGRARRATRACWCRG